MSQPSSSPTWEKYEGGLLDLTDKTANYLEAQLAMLKETWNNDSHSRVLKFGGLKTHIQYYDFKLENHK